MLIGGSSFSINLSIVLWVAGLVRKSAIQGSRKYACFSRGSPFSTSGGNVDDANVLRDVRMHLTPQYEVFLVAIRDLHGKGFP